MPELLGLPSRPRRVPRGGALQERLRERVIAGELPELMLLLEHPPVYTVGRRTERRDLAVRRGVLPRARDRHRAHAARRAAHLPRARPARRLPDHARRDVPEYILTMERAIVAALADAGVEAAHAARPQARRRVGRATARSPRSACTSRTASPRTASRSTWTTTWTRSAGSWPAGCPEVPMTSMARRGRERAVACFRKRMALPLRRGVRAAPADRQRPRGSASSRWSPLDGRRRSRSS